MHESADTGNPTGDALDAASPWRVPRWAWIAGGGAIAAMLLGLVIVSVLGPDGGDAPVAGAPSTTAATTMVPSTTAPSTTATTTTTSTTVATSATGPESTTTSVALTSLTAPDRPPWVRVVDDALAGDRAENLRGVAYDGTRLVAVGEVDRYVPAAWGSADGLDWWVAASGSAFGGRPDLLLLNDVVAAGPGFVAVGSDRSGDDSDAAVWTSTDGSSWTRRARAELSLRLDQAMYGIAVVDSTIIAVGVESDGATGEAAIWTSEDGLSWKRVPYAEATSGWREMRDVAELPGGGLVAVGIAGGEGEPQEDAGFAVWLSDDGLRWERQPASAVVVGGSDNRSIDGVATGSDGLRAFGSMWFRPAGFSDAATWISEDGLLWSAASWDDPVLLAAGDQAMADGLVVGDRWIAVGWEVTHDIELDAAVWISPLE